MMIAAALGIVTESRHRATCAGPRIQHEHVSAPICEHDQRFIAARAHVTDRER